MLNERVVQSRAVRTQETIAMAGTMDAVANRLLALPPNKPRAVSKKLAAVLVPLFSDSEGVVRVVLTQRSSSLPTHQGEVSYSGGGLYVPAGLGVCLCLRAHTSACE